MGAYTNPQEVLDTQTGQHFQNLQKTISDTMASVATSYKADMEKTKAKYAKLDEKVNEQTKAVQSLNDKTSTDTGIDLNVLNGSVNKYKEIATNLALGKTDDPVKASQKLVQIEGYSSKIANDTAQWSDDTDGFKAMYNKKGKPGGISQNKDLNPTNTVTNYLVATKMIKGKLELQDPGDNFDDRTYKITTEINGVLETHAMSGNAMQQNSLNSALVVIPDTSAKMIENRKAIGFYKMKDAVSPDGAKTSNVIGISEKYLIKDIIRRPSASTDPSKKVEELYQKVDIDLIKKDLGPLAVKEIDEMFTVDDRQLVAWYNENYKENIEADRGGKIDPITLDEVRAGDKNAIKQKLYNAYVELSVLGLPKTQDVKEAPSDTATITTEIKGPNNPNNPNKETKAQKIARIKKGVLAIALKRGWKAPNIIKETNNALEKAGLL